MTVRAEIVFAGGPCAGKTTALSMMTEWLGQQGYRVLTVPEIPTIYITGGVSDIGRLAVEAPDAYLDVQASMMRAGHALREEYRRLAATAFAGDDVVILHDRTEADQLPYVSDEQAYRLLLERCGLSWAQVRDAYTLVVMLVTAADGAEAYYTTANNAARLETPAEARALQVLTEAAWIGTPRLAVIDNSTDFEGKLQRVRQAVAHALGLPVPLEIERKYLLAEAPKLERLEAAGARPIEIEQAYLQPGPAGEERRLRRRGAHGAATYYLTTKTDIRPGVRAETERQISPTEYGRLWRDRDTTLAVVRKTRWCLLWQRQYFELDEIHEPAEHALWLLEVELTDENQSVTLPPWLTIEREVTTEAAYRNRALALV